MDRSMEPRRTCPLTGGPCSADCAWAVEVDGGLACGVVAGLAGARVSVPAGSAPAWARTQPMDADWDAIERDALGGRG